MERKLGMFTEEREKERRLEREERHRTEIEKLRDIYKEEAKAERHLTHNGNPDFKRTKKCYAWNWIGENVILPCQLNLETSIVPMTIGWFKETECIYLYKNGQVIEGRGYEDRLTLDTQELRKGNVSLTLKEYRETDKGVYICQVTHGEQMEETAVELNTNPLRRNDEEIRIVVVGKHGVGKSASGNTILGDEVFKSRRSYKSVTERSQKATSVVAGRKVSVIDTPDLFDTKFTEEFRQCFGLAAPGPHVFLVLCKLWDCFTEDERKIVEIIQETFGELSVKYAMILFTHSDLLDEDQFSECVENPDVSQLIDNCSGRYHLFNNKTQDQSQVTELLEKIYTMVSENGRSHYTTEKFQKADEAREEDKILPGREALYLYTQKEENGRAKSAHLLETQLFLKREGELQNVIKDLKVKLQERESELEKVKIERDSKLEGPPEPTRRKICLSDSAEKKIFFEKMKPELVARVKTVMPILDELQVGGFHEEMAAKIQKSDNTDQDRMRTILEHMTSKSRVDDLYDALLKHEPSVMDDLLIEYERKS